MLTKLWFMTDKPPEHSMPKTVAIVLSQLVFETGGRRTVKFGRGKGQENFDRGTGTSH